MKMADHFQNFEQMGKIFRQRSRCFHIFSGPGMPEAEDHGMEPSAPADDRAVLPFPGNIAAVNLITQKRMSDSLHMHPDLMGPSRLQTAFDIGKTP